MKFVGIVPFKFKGERKYKNAIAVKNEFSDMANFICFDENLLLQNKDLKLKDALEKSKQKLHEQTTNLMGN
ncbi:MAG: hypothetical protein GXO47_14020 [Chlorobi bacterium]|nr:hypothetical protein [Chlorobiota bacterium]